MSSQQKKSELSGANELTNLINNEDWLFTDGACSGNPGPGGWGFVLRYNHQSAILEKGGFAEATTNNRMELQAVVEGISAWLKLSDAKVDHSATTSTKNLRILLDSTYVRKGASQWMSRWKRNGWQTQEGKPVANQDLWIQLSELLEAIYSAKGANFLLWTYLPGHSGIAGNERADKISVDCGQKQRKYKKTFPTAEYPLDLNDWISIQQKENASNKGAEENIVSTKKFPLYIALIGRKVVEFSDWPQCEQAVKGTSGAKFKKVKNNAEFIDTLKKWGISVDDLLNHNQR